MSSASTRGRPLVDLHAYQLPARDAKLAAEVSCARIIPTARACTGRSVDSRAIDRKIAGLMRPSVDRFHAPTGAASGSPEAIVSSLLALFLGVLMRVRRPLDVASRTGWRAASSCRVLLARKASGGCSVDPKLI